ncbi:MAG: 1-acyl-sn-glycerol-3-phosphate acyltransferase [Coriobacteriales bacterium]|jgi:1-acyl-sn-glycerol-3-phosphate acyltransferase|nr:1-acyl-sn-glycerol-3-phosphate acyltransferase [Coriobacteriales bacterium]
MKPLDHFYDNPVNRGRGTPRIFDHLFAGLIRVTFTPAFRCRVRGAEEIRRLDEGFILAGNHRSYLDPLFVMQAMRPRAIRFMGKEEFFRVKVLRRLASWVGVYPVKRETADIKVVKRSVTMLKRGEIVGIFPEGTRGRGTEVVDGERKTYEGVAHIANLAKARVVPFRLFNTEKISPEDSRRWHFPTIKLAFGEPMSLDDPAYEGLDKSEKIQRFTQEVMGVIYSLPEPE